MKALCVLNPIVKVSLKKLILITSGVMTSFIHAGRCIRFSENVHILY